MEKINTFIKRLDKIGIKIIIHNNLPWIYMHKINNKVVKEVYRAKQGFTIAFLPMRKEQGLEFTDITEIFKLIRKYI